MTSGLLVVVCRNIRSASPHLCDATRQSTRSFALPFFNTVRSLWGSSGSSAFTSARQVASRRFVFSTIDFFRASILSCGEGERVDVGGGVANHALALDAAQRLLECATYPTAGCNYLPVPSSP